MNFRQIFTEYIAVLEKHREQLTKFAFDLENIRMILNTLDTSETSFSYSFSTLQIIIDKSLLPSHSIPKEFNYVQIILSIESEVKINIVRNSFVTDPFIELEKFNIKLYCDKKNYTSSWHLDRHKRDENEELPSNLHPIYHLTFGGTHMENLQNSGSDFGRALILRTPRITHPPMEVILGIDFIFNHFIPKSELDLLSDRRYIEVINKLKSYIWLPYSLAIAKNYCERISIDSQPYSFDEAFVKSVLG